MFMTVREQVVSKLNLLTEEQIKQVADFLDFLKFREKMIKDIHSPIVFHSS